MRKQGIFAIVIAIAGLTIFAGCGNADKAANVPVTPKWQGAPYHISFDTPPAKPSSAGVTLPAIKYTANPDALERRASIVVRFDESAAKTDKQVINQMIMAPVDISGTDGKLPADYMDLVNKNLAGLLGAYCIKGKVKVTVAMARSSLSLTADEAEIDNKLLSDWLSTEVTFKNPHPKC
ncbi:MAG TPA: hypothetical protein VMD29_05695 [Terracidiphilus sp.]|nr:hypothetical protein [Terracidiphilus sp.]